MVKALHVVLCSDQICPTTKPTRRQERCASVYAEFAEQALSKGCWRIARWTNRSISFLEAVLKGRLALTSRALAVV